MRMHTIFFYPFLFRCSFGEKLRNVCNGWVSEWVCKTEQLSKTKVILAVNQDLMRKKKRKSVHTQSSRSKAETYQPRWHFERLLSAKAVRFGFIAIPDGQPPGIPFMFQVNLTAWKIKIHICDKWQSIQREVRKNHKKNPIQLIYRNHV